MTEDHTPDRRFGKSHRWNLIYLVIVALTFIVYLMLWFFSQAFLR